MKRNLTLNNTCNAQDDLGADKRAGRDCGFFRKKKSNQLIYLLNSTL